jgi:hypothetical protein
MRKVVTYLAIGIAVLAIAIQFIRPARTNPQVDPSKDMMALVSVPPEVRAVLERSCFDCHSNRTTWPWYSHVAPASWLVANDVSEGRKHLNFSEWGGYKTGRQRSKLESLIGEVDKAEMPPGTYLIMHRGAALSASERDLVTGWAESLSDSLNAAPK